MTAVSGGGAPRFSSVPLRCTPSKRGDYVVLYEIFDFGSTFDCTFLDNSNMECYHKNTVDELTKI